MTTPPQHPASNSSARKRDAGGVAVGGSLSEAETVTAGELDALRAALVNARWEAALATELVGSMNARERNVVRAEVKAEVAWYVGAVADWLAQRTAAAKVEAWPCDNYIAPVTCLTAPSSGSGRCSWCRSQATAAKAEGES